MTSFDRLAEILLGVLARAGAPDANDAREDDEEELDELANRRTA